MHTVQRYGLYNDLDKGGINVIIKYKKKNIERSQQTCKEVHLVVIDKKKAFDRVAVKGLLEVCWKLESVVHLIGAMLVENTGLTRITQCYRYMRDT